MALVVPVRPLSPPSPLATAPDWLGLEREGCLSRLSLSRLLGGWQPATLTQVPLHQISLPPSGSRFLILDSVPMDDLDIVASDCSIIFRGESGPRLEQIAAIKAKEMYEGALAASRGQAERERAGAPESTGPMQEAPGSSNGDTPLPSSEVGPTGTPQVGGGRGGDLPWLRLGPRPEVGLAQSLVGGPPPMLVSNEFSHLEL
jgi:hypothetical protein